MAAVIPLEGMCSKEAHHDVVRRLDFGSASEREVNASMQLPSSRFTGGQERNGCVAERPRAEEGRSSLSINPLTTPSDAVMHDVMCGGDEEDPPHIPSDENGYEPLATPGTPVVQLRTGFSKSLEMRGVRQTCRHQGA